MKLKINILRLSGRTGRCPLPNSTVRNRTNAPSDNVILSEARAHQSAPESKDPAFASAPDDGFGEFGSNARSPGGTSSIRSMPCCSPAIPLAYAANLKRELPRIPFVGVNGIVLPDNVILSEARVNQPRAELKDPAFASAPDDARGSSADKAQGPSTRPPSLRSGGLARDDRFRRDLVILREREPSGMRSERDRRTYAFLNLRPYPR